MYSWIGVISLHCFHKPGHHNFGLEVDALPAANQLPYYQPHQTGRTVGSHFMLTYVGVLRYCFPQD